MRSWIRELPDGATVQARFVAEGALIRFDGETGLPVAECCFILPATSEE